MSDSSIDDPFAATHTDSDENYTPAAENRTTNRFNNTTLLDSSESDEDLAETFNEAGVPGPSNKTPQTGRKRLQRRVLWKRNIIKSRRAEGKSYVNTAGTVVAEKTLGEPCNCSKKCFDKIGEGCRLIFAAFYNLPSKNLQDSYLYGLIKRRPVKRKRPRVGCRESRLSSFVYTVISIFKYFLTYR